MSVEIVMPSLSDSMVEGTILGWMKRVGDEIVHGDELVEIETDKANMAYKAELAGTLVEIVAAEGETLAIGSPIARVRTAGEEGPSAPPAGKPRAKASPVARRLAEDRGIELATLSGSGPGGRIVKTDVEAADVSAPAPAPAGRSTEAVPALDSADTAKGRTEVQELSRAQQVVARRMAESKAVAPHFYLTIEVEMRKAVEARAAISATARDGDVVPSFNDIIVRATAIALADFPKANGAYRNGQFELHSRINIGVAVAAPGQLLVPTVFDADHKGLRQIAEATRSLADRVVNGTITPPELSGGTFTVSNLGMYGTEEFQAVINQPQAGILAVGAIREAPAVRDGEVVATQLMKATLSCDHRILYGAEGAEFLARVKQVLEEPVCWAL